MPASSSRRTIALATVLAMSASAYAQAPERGAGARPAARPAARDHLQQAAAQPGAPANPADAFLPSAAIADDALLDRSRGGDSRTTVDTRFTGTVNGNSATNVSTGWNVIQGDSFANMTGIPIVIQNSGANVLIQNATVINLQLQ